MLLFATPREPQFLTVASVSVDVRSDVLQADGAGVLRVSAAGAFRPDDVLVFDLDRHGADDADEAFALGTTSASFEVPLEDIVDGNYDVLYLPNGVDPLRSGSVTTTFAVDFHK